MRVWKLLLKTLLTLFLGAILLVGLLYLLFGRGGEAEEIKWGTSFDPYYAEYLGLDWKKTYLSLLDDLGVDHFRIVAFWDALEPEAGRYDFERLDFQVKEAERRGAKLIVAVGRRLPRWPECHIPSWAKELSDEAQHREVLELAPVIINRYKESPAVEYWQVENEPYVWFFGDCPGADQEFMEELMALVSRHDPSHPIMITESGELSTWFRISLLGDRVGISMYRNIYDGTFLGRYHSYWFFPQQTYRIKANLYKSLGMLDEVFVSELQAEPWGPKPLTEMSLEEQYRSFNPEQFRYNIQFARSTGFDRFYLWGAEWWFYAKEKLGVPDFVEEASKLWQN